MPSSYTDLLRLTKPADGELVGTWGQTVNNGITELEEDAIAGTAVIAVPDADKVLTVVNGATDEARAAVLNITGALTAQRNVICPAVSKTYIVRNSTTGGFGVQIKTAAGTGVVVPAGGSMLVYCDGVNVVNALTGGSGFGLADDQPLFWGDGSVAIAGNGATDVLRFNTAAVERMRIDTAGNVGIGAAPSGWGATYRAVQVYGSSFAGASNGTDTLITANAIQTGGTWVSRVSGVGSAYIQNGAGSHAWYTAGSVAAGAPLSFVERMVIDAAGNVGIGITPSAWGGGFIAEQIRVLALWSNPAAPHSYVTNNIYFDGSTRRAITGGAVAEIQMAQDVITIANSGAVAAGTAVVPVERMRIDATGNVGIGTAVPAALGAGYTSLSVQGANGAAIQVRNSSGSGVQLYGDSGTGLVESTGPVPLIFRTSSVERMRINTNGVIGVAVSSVFSTFTTHPTSPSILVHMPVNAPQAGLQIGAFLETQGTNFPAIHIAPSRSQPDTYSMKWYATCTNIPATDGFPIYRYDFVNFQYAGFSSTSCAVYGISGQWNFAVAIANPSSAHLKANWAYETGGLVDGLAAITDVGSFDFNIGTYPLDFPIPAQRGQPILVRQVGVAAEALQAAMPDAVNDPNGDGNLHVTYGNAALVACIALAKRLVALEAVVAAL